MKILICTTPIRPVPTDYPPIGSLAVIQALRDAGYQPIFYDIDGLRPTFSEVIEKLKTEAPDLIGISAVVSTAYGYVKALCREIKKELPRTRIVLGGNLAASAELLHRYCGVDICVAGEGERVMVNLVRQLEREGPARDLAGLSKVPGITYLNAAGELTFTGYEAAIPAAELCDPDFSILERYSRIENFVTDPFGRWDFAQDPRSRQPRRAGKKMALVTSTKGCVARCTFCHRWDRGFRQIPPERVIGRIRALMEKYNVGFVMFGDENFGSDLKALDELIERIRPLDILWQVGGIRARTVDPERLRRMREAGCVALYYGFETGSPDILKVMEKNLDLSHNLTAARATHEAGLFTVYQLVLGMPGETHRTVSETIAMVKQITEFLPEPPFQYLSINYIQALPGTPVYEYARAQGKIAPGLEGEDAYLTSISDIDAGDDTKFLNFTDHPYLTVQSWRPRILYEATEHWHRVRRKNRGFGAARISPQKDGEFKEYQKGGYFNLQEIQRNPTILLALYPFRKVFIGLWTLLAAFRRSSHKVALAHLWEWLSWRSVKRTEKFQDYRSLRQVIKEAAPLTAPLRLGR